MPSASPAEPAGLARTPLHALHRALGAKMVPFAGYDMPLHSPAGVLAEHLHTRAAAGLFDVSHMGQALLAGPDYETVASALEALCPADLIGLPPGRQRYTQLLNADGGVLDDLMATRPAEPDAAGQLTLVVNAARKAFDFDHVEVALPNAVRLTRLPDRALIALQGPKAADVLARLAPLSPPMRFMDARSFAVAGVACWVSRSGYTGEDGFELSIRAEDAQDLARALLAQPEVLPIGLGARDSLRLEAGLCLYGHDIDARTSPVEASLAWSIGKRRRAEGGYPGAGRIARELAEGPARRRVGLSPDGRAPAREGTPIVDLDGRAIGTVTSGGFGPSLNGPLAMGYVAAAQAAPGTRVLLVVRGKALPARVAPLPFVPHSYRR